MKLEPRHIVGYLPHKLMVHHIERNINGYIAVSKDYFRDYCEQYWTADSVLFNIEKYKPLLRPLSSLYTEIDGMVGIVELAKMLSGTVLVDKIDGCCTNLSYFKCTFEDGFEELIINENCEGWYRSYFDKNQPSTGRNVINQFEVFQYLFSHHFDVFGLIDKGLAIDKTKIK
ncbi:hypothetical protein [Dysgonomonas mossii]|uniref:Uncharacterized protein n=1 Tax=Dysgonomonas mossii DSM 22836 TaxID=742767 RepID=F8X549_9BACT|nr:hypothetical protein [Dysgonomonas mossii]EGK04747.1 hypothetical protein HMPREF9456_03358 [Dysgonomonas mossii DSM 22836]